MMFALIALTAALLADADWQPVSDGLKLLLGTVNTALIFWVLSKQRGNDKDTKTAKDASLATAATNGVTTNVLPEVEPMRKAINGGALASRVAALEISNAKFVADLPRLVREAVRTVRDETTPGDGRDNKPRAGG